MFARERYLTLLLLFLWLFFSCVPAEPEPEPEITIGWQNPEFQKIYEYGIQGNWNKVGEYSSAVNPNHRYCAAYTAAAITEKPGEEILLRFLNDSFPEIRALAAYGIGKTGHSKYTSSLVDAFMADDTTGRWHHANARILEAVGRIGSSESVKDLTSISTYTPNDSVLNTGRIRGIYYASLRDMYEERGTDFMLNVLQDKSYTTEQKIYAADYFARWKDPHVNQYKYALQKVFENADIQFIKISMLKLFSNSKDPRFLSIIKSVYEGDNEGGLRLAALNALPPFEINLQSLINLLTDNDPRIRIKAAELLHEKANEDHALILQEKADSLAQDVVLSAILYQGALKHFPYYFGLTRNMISNTLRQMYKSTPQPKEKFYILRAMTADKDNYNYIYKALAEDDLPHWVKTKLYNYFYNNVKGRSGPLSDESLTELALETRDMGMIGESITNIKKSEDTELFQRVKDSLAPEIQVPEQLELAVLLDLNLSDLNYRSVNWKLVMDGQVEIITDEGAFTVTLFPEVAPLTVSTILSSIKEDHYKGKVIHRVVPNFVIQGGGVRGDGYGGSNFLLRTEAPPVYYSREGRAGIASAGMHTEGDQWFITLQPTPHLDSRYTVWGEVTDGEGVLKRITQQTIVKEINFIK